MRRLSISLLVIVLLATIGFGWTLDRLFIELQPDEADRLAPYRIVGEALVSGIESGNDINSVTANWPEDSALQLSVIDFDALALPDALRADLNQGESLALEAEEGVTLFVPIAGGSSALAMSLPPATSTAEAALRFALSILFYAGIVSLILLWVYPLVRRLHALSKAAHEFGAGNFSSRVPITRFSLIKNIETEFNAMAERIATLVEDNRLLSSAVSHDLRTPLARLRFGLDALSEEDDVAVQEKYMQRISGDLAEMEHLVEVLLDYARLEKQQRELPLTPMALVPRVTERINALFNDTSHDIEWEPTKEGASDDIWVMANERYIDMVINNVLQNAQRYGKSKIRVSISTSHKNDRRVWLIIEDDGPGIPDEERSRVLKPFERGRANIERARPASAQSKSAAIQQNALSSGFGMGLAIVNRILQWHGAQLVLSNSEKLGGASVEMGFRSSAPMPESQSHVKD